MLPLLAQGPWPVVLLITLTSLLSVALVVAAKVIMMRMALDGSDPKDRPAILKALAEMFRAGWWTRRTP